MDHHAFLCGASKSKEADAYYIHHNNRFWGTLHDAGITDTQIQPENYRRLGEQYGIYLTEIVDPDEYRVSSDSDIQPHQVESGLNTLMERIGTHRPKRVAFVGKNAATWFYRYNEDKEITDSQDPRHKSDRKNLGYGELGWNYNSLEYYLLTNTHRQWEEEVWRNSWKHCLKDADKFRRK